LSKILNTQYSDIFEVPKNLSIDDIKKVLLKLDINFNVPIDNFKKFLKYDENDFLNEKINDSLNVTNISEFIDSFLSLKANSTIEGAFYDYFKNFVYSEFETLADDEVFLNSEDISVLSQLFSSVISQSIPGKFYLFSNDSYDYYLYPTDKDKYIYNFDELLNFIKKYTISKYKKDYSNDFLKSFSGISLNLFSNFNSFSAFLNLDVSSKNSHFLDISNILNKKIVRKKKQ
jgi:hypothetical protein